MMKEWYLILLLGLLSSDFSAKAAPDRKLLNQQLPIQNLTPSTGHYDSSNRLSLVIGLPVRDRAALDRFLRDVYDSKSTNFHHFLTSKEFTERFGPSEADYNAVVNFAKGNGFIITKQHPGRMILEVEATSGDVERAFNVKMLTYTHPTEKRQFFAPDSRPSLPSNVPILEIGGLNDFSKPRPLSTGFRSLDKTFGSQAEWSGEGPYKTYIPKDFRAAYASDVSLDGSGQSVALLEFDSCYAADIQAYATEESLPKPSLKYVRLPGANSTPGPFNVEVATDVEMAIGMAPGLSSVILYQAPQTNNYDSQYIGLLLRMVEDDAAGQLSSSWNPPVGSTLIQDQIFQQMAAQGQSFFQASGDDGAYADGVHQRADSPYVTIVGGTSLSIDIWGYSGPGVEYYFPVYWGEQVWNGGSSNNVSGGGISTNYAIPFWQQNVDMTSNGGSAVNRNSPDVAMIADGVYVRAGNGKWGAIGGTSVAAPMWAGFTALINQQASKNGLPNVGFLNPAIYTLCQGSNYSALFHDVTSGNNTTPASPTAFYAAAGYDLCTGWGSPAGQHFIDALTTGKTALSIAPTNGFAATGLAGGPVDVTQESFLLQNTGWIPLKWAVGNVPSWLDVSSNFGMLDADEPGVAVNVSLNVSATNLGPGLYSATLIFTNLTDGTETPESFSLRVWQLGSLQVTLGPDAAIPAGAQWRVDGGSWQTSGAIILGLYSSNHVVDFATIPNWTIPSSQVVAIAGNVTNTVSAVYGQQFGSLTVALFPTDAVIAGAHWRVDNGPWLGTGDTASGLATTNHTISFSTISGWDTPTDISISVKGNQTATNSGVYGERYRFVTIAGKAGFAGSADGTNQNARFSSPNGIVWYNGNLFVVDTGNNLIRELVPQGTNWIVNTVAGEPGVSGTVDGIGTNAQFDAPLGIAVDGAGNLYVTDTGNDTVRELINETNQWAVSTLAGVPGYYGYPYDGDTNHARLLAPGGIAVDGNGNLWFSQLTGNEYGNLRSLGNSGGIWSASTVVNNIGMPYGVMQGQHGVYLVNAVGTASYPGDCILALTGNPYLGGQYLVPVTAFAFSGPRGLAEDTQGNVYVADTGNSAIRKLFPFGWTSLNFPNYAVSTVAGAPSNSGTNDGVGSEVRFSSPSSIAVDTLGRLYVSDTGNHTIRLGASTLISMTVLATPNDPSIQAATFQVDGGAWTPVGTTFRLSPGDHTITFQTVPGWTTPPRQAVNVSSNEIITGTYVQQFGSVQVMLGPANAVAAGAQWQLDSGAWQDNGVVLTGLTAGQHVLSFRPINGWVTPAGTNIDVPGAATNTVPVDYWPIDTNRPSVQISTPAAGQTWVNPTILLQGTAHDDVGVASVWYQINGSGWYLAAGTNQWETPETAEPPGIITAQVYAVDSSGNISATNTISFTNAPSVLLTVTVTGLGTISPNLNGQLLVIGKSYSLTAKPALNWNFGGWSGDISATAPSISFVAESNMALRANFVPNPYLATAGTYVGLFYNTNTVTIPSSGFFSAQVSSKGTFSAAMQIESENLHFTGTFSQNGAASNYLVRAFNPISLQLSLSSSNETEIVGELSATQWKAHLVAYRVPFSKTHSAPQAGRYTLGFSGGEGSFLEPGGFGFGSATVSALGSVKFSGTLGDGAVVSQSGFISEDGLWPFYISLYSGTGAILGWLQFSDSADDLQGKLIWIKRPQPTATYYSAGFSIQATAAGSRYSPTSGQPSLGFTNGQIVLRGAGLSEPLTNFVSMTGKTISSQGSAAITIVSSSGLFHGSIRNPATGQNVNFNGALLQNASAGYGLFLGTNQTGEVLLTPQPSP